MSESEHSLGRNVCGHPLLDYGIVGRHNMGIGGEEAAAEVSKKQELLCVSVLLSTRWLIE